MKKNLTILESLSFLLVVFLDSKCCFHALLLTIFPLPVTRNLFAEACKTTKTKHGKSSKSKLEQRETGEKPNLVGLHLVPFCCNDSESGLVLGGGGVGGGVGGGWVGEWILGRATGNPETEVDELSLLFFM